MIAALQGARLGAYELIERIGEGGMAEVYRAKQLTAFSREVALKVIRPEFTGDEPFRRRFLREAHAISRLSHPNILPLIEFGEEKGTLYLVMPLVREGTLRDLLHQQQGPLELVEALSFFVPLCDAVQYAHQEDIIHRDIKPQNVLLQRHTHVLLADFGIARDRFDTHMTTTGVGLGSVEYMAPEQAEGRADAQSDIYSLGIVLFQMLTGVVPYSGSLPLEVLLKKASDPAPDPRRHNPHLPASIADILQIALARDPGQRFETAGALGQAAQEIRPYAARPPIHQWAIGLPGPQAPVPQDKDLATTIHVSSGKPSSEAQESTSSQSISSLPTEPMPDASAFTLQASGQPFSHQPEGLPAAEGRTVAAETYEEDGNYQPPKSARSTSRSPDDGTAGKSRGHTSALLVAALVAILILTLAVSTIASGHLGLGWFHPGTAQTGAQPVTPTPGVTVQPTQRPVPISTPPAQPTTLPQPASTATPQPTQAPTPGPTDTATPQPTAPPTPNPTDTATPQPTAPATPQPTAPPTPGPTDSATPQPTAPPAPDPTQAPALTHRS